MVGFNNVWETYPMDGTTVPHAYVPIVNNNDKSPVGRDLDAKKKN